MKELFALSVVHPQDPCMCWLLHTMTWDLGLSRARDGATMTDGFGPSRAAPQFRLLGFLFGSLLVPS